MSKDIMLDIETLGVGIGPVITQISAVSFDLETGETGEEFNILVDPMSCIRNNLKVNNSTFKFWSGQDKDVFKKVVLNSFLEGKELKDSLELLNEFIETVRGNSDSKKVTVWGNGIMADNVWLTSAYEECNVLPEWKYSEHRDVRTLVDLGKILNLKDYKSDTEFEGERHNAIDDCKHQIRYCSSYIKELKES